MRRYAVTRGQGKRRKKKLTVPCPPPLSRCCVFDAAIVASVVLACHEMKRVFGAVSGALRTLVPKASAPAIPAAAHQERVRKAMESLAPPGRRLPSESKALAMELVAGGKEMPAKTPEEMYLAANALHLVRPEWQEGCTTTLGCFLNGSVDAVFSRNRQEW